MSNSNIESKDSNDKWETSEKVEKELKYVPEYEELKEIPTGNSVRALISGTPGAGKTEFCGTAGDGLLLINVGKGVETLQNKGFIIRNPKAQNIKVINIDKIFDKKGELPSEQEMVNAISDAVYHATRTQRWLKTVAIDDMSEYRFYALWQGMEINKVLGRSQSFEQSKKHDMPLPVVQDFGVEMGVVEDFLRWFCDDAYQREYNIIVTSHTRHVYKKALDGNGKPIMGQPPTLIKELPGFTGQTFPDYIPRLFSIVGQLEPNVNARTGENNPRLRLAGDSSKCVKHRYSGVLPEYMDNPRFDTIIEAIKSNRAINKDGKIV